MPQHNSPPESAHPALDTAIELYRRLNRHAQQRHAGILLTWSIAFFTLVLLGVMASAILQNTGPLSRGRSLRLHAQPPWIQVPALIAFIGITLSIPITLAGIVIRFASAHRLARLLKATDPTHLGPLPPPTHHERLGWWVITTLNSDTITLTRRPAPALIWVIARWAVTTLIISCLAMAIIANIRASSAPALLLAIGFILVWGVPLLLLFRTTTLQLDARRNQLRLRTRVTRFLPSFGTTCPLDAITTFRAADRSVVLELSTATRAGARLGTLILDHLHPGPLGRWQAQRLAALLEAFVASSAPTTPMRRTRKPQPTTKPNPFAPAPLPITPGSNPQRLP